MEERIDLANHTVELNNRETIHISGIKKIERLNENEFVLDTIMGFMSILGNNLEMVSLKIDLGELVINGNINQIKYDAATTTEKKPSFFAKLFK